MKIFEKEKILFVTHVYIMHYTLHHIQDYLIIHYLIYHFDFFKISNEDKMQIKSLLLIVRFLN